MNMDNIYSIIFAINAKSISITQNVGPAKISKNSISDISPQIFQIVPSLSNEIIHNRFFLKDRLLSLQGWSLLY